MQTLIYQRNQLTRVIGMDVPGRADALGLGWVYMKAEEWPSGDYSENRRRRRVYHLYGDESAG
ncbi:penicillin-binding protein AmpH [Klebsiella variicola]|uniref:Penicillin-binding protein AmpH n=1 Tax=Klebsiella variicola TaxID=244366 RepID=A0A7H4ME92_KLEVA|nr:penicillin-binding protein AmpH [Klebsiella variicola]